MAEVGNGPLTQISQTARLLFLLPLSNARAADPICHRRLQGARQFPIGTGVGRCGTAPVLKLQNIAHGHACVRSCGSPAAEVARWRYDRTWVDGDLVACQKIQPDMVPGVAKGKCRHTDWQQSTRMG
jgi:hypothetical protein